MRKINPTFQIILLLLFISFSGCLTPENSNHEFPPNTFDISTLQQAIDNANDHEVIYLKSGTCTAPIYVNTSVVLSGLETMPTVINVRSNLSSPIFIIQTESCILRNITFVNLYENSLGNTTFSSAIEIYSSDTLIERVVIRNFSLGINIKFNDNLIENTIIANVTTGIEILNADNNQVKNCTLTNCKEFGVFIGFESKYNRISFSTFTNINNGVRIKGAQKNTVYRNTFINCQKAFYECCGAKDNDFILNDER
jgi:hypothetical protein